MIGIVVTMIASYFGAQQIFRFDKSSQIIGGLLCIVAAGSVIYNFWNYGLTKGLVSVVVFFIAGAFGSPRNANQ